MTSLLHITTQASTSFKLISATVLFCCGLALWFAITVDKPTMKTTKWYHRADQVGGLIVALLIFAITACLYAVSNVDHNLTYVSTWSNNTRVHAVLPPTKLKVNTPTKNDYIIKTADPAIQRTVLKPGQPAKKTSSTVLQSGSFTIDRPFDLQKGDIVTVTLDQTFKVGDYVSYFNGSHDSVESAMYDMPLHVIKVERPANSQIIWQENQEGY